MPAASTLWISVAQELCQPPLAKCESAWGRTRLSKHSPCKKPFSVQIWTNRNTPVSLISYAVTCPHFTVIDSRDRKRAPGGFNNVQGALIFKGKEWYV